MRSSVTLHFLILLTFLGQPAHAQSNSTAGEEPAATKTTVTNEAFGFEVRYPSNWSASQTSYEDPFAGAYTSEGSSVEIGIVGHGEAPEGWNVLTMAGPGAPFDLRITAHPSEALALSSMVEALRTRFQEQAQDPMFSTNTDATWNGYPAREIVAELGWGTEQYVIVRADDVRYVFFCTTSFRADDPDVCRDAIEEHVEFELLHAEAETIDHLEEETDPAGGGQASLEEALRAWTPVELFEGATRIQANTSQRGGRPYLEAVYATESGPIVLNVIQLSDEQIENFRGQEGLTEATHQGRTVYETSQGNSDALQVFLDDFILALAGRGAVNQEALYAALDALDVAALEALVLDE